MQRNAESAIHKWLASYSGQPLGTRDAMSKQPKKSRGAAGYSATLCRTIGEVRRSLRQQTILMTAMFTPAKKAALGPAMRVALSRATSLPGFLVPAWQSTAAATAARQFSTTGPRPSKLGRTPISIPPGVELTIGEPRMVNNMTSYKPKVIKTINIKGPLG